MSDRLQAMRANSRADWTIRDVNALCAEFGILCQAPRGGGSHYRVAHPAILDKLTIPARRPIKPIYMKRLVAFVDALEISR